MKIFNNQKLSSILYPKVVISIISNDSIYISEFLKQFNLNIPFTIFQYKNGESFLDNIRLQKQSKQRYSIIISDFDYETNDSFFVKNGLDIFNEIEKEILNLEYILLFDKKAKKQLTKQQNKLHLIEKNNNSHLRVKYLIQSLYNNRNIEIQSEFNKKLFSILLSFTIIILIIFGIAVFLQI